MYNSHFQPVFKQQLPVCIAGGWSLSPISFRMFPHLQCLSVQPLVFLVVIPLPELEELSFLFKICVFISINYILPKIDIFVF